jgi:hypothetical protein
MLGPRRFIAVGTIVAAVGVGLPVPIPVDAATYYVRTSGSDSNDGRGPSTAFKTITRAAADARGGDTVIVGPGIYREGDIKPDGNGRRGEVVRFVGDRDGVTTGDPPGHVLVDATGYLNGFRIAGRPWVVISGFSITNATESGLEIKSTSDFSLVANCTAFSNGSRGIRIRDSLGVVVFNSLVYDNGGTGIDFGGEISGAARGAAIHNTVYANGLDGIRIEGVIPSSNLLVLNNLIVNNLGIGLNLKEGSRAGFVGQWNLITDNQTAAYNTLDIARGALDLSSAPLLVLPPGADGILGGAGYVDDDFHLSQLAVGQIADSPAVDASGITAGKVKLSRASTRTDRGLDAGRSDLGFHFGAAVDLMTATGGRIAERLRQFRARAVQCDRKTVKAQSALDRGRGPCARSAALARLERKCGTAVRAACR